MKKVKFYFTTGYVNCGCEEIMEYEDNATEKEIASDFETWLYENSDATWYEVEGGEDEKL